jgi:hypothetical protein
MTPLSSSWGTIISSSLDGEGGKKTLTNERISRKNRNMSRRVDEMTKKDERNCYRYDVLMKIYTENK